MEKLFGCAIVLLSPFGGMLFYKVLGWMGMP